VEPPLDHAFEAIGSVSEDGHSRLFGPDLVLKSCMNSRANGANLASCIHRFSRLGAQYFNAYRAPTSADYGHGA
jgi:hypothetical protein